MASHRTRRYDTQRQLRLDGEVDSGKARILCASQIDRCGSYWPRKRLKLGYCPDCWKGGGTLNPRV